MEEEEDNSGMSKQSKFNSGFLINMRLDALWKDCHKHSRQGQYTIWNLDLDRVWCELAGDEEKDSEAETDFDNINKKLEKVGEISNLSSGFNKMTTDKLKKIKTFYILLTEKEKFLRRLQNSQGKGTAYQTDDSYMFD